MLVKKTFLIALCLLLTSFSVLWAGDIASFIDLGFSADGGTYMFGQYGVLERSLRPWAELFIVDVGKNNFVQNGRISRTHDTAIAAGQDGSGILYQLMADNSAFANRHGINYQNQGLPLYISREENPPSRGETIEFRDFVSGNSYKAQLIPAVEGAHPDGSGGQNIRSSFYINVESRTRDGFVRTYTVGTPQLKRQGIAAYNFKRVLIDAGGRSVIFVIEMRRVAQNGHDIRYMVEALRL